MANENANPTATSEQSPMLAPGTMLQGGKYRIEKVLGQGGFGITYLATMMMLNQKVAIKEFFFKEFCERNTTDSTVLVPTQSKKDLVDRFKTKFLKEAKIIFGLRHENIIKLLDVFQENDTSYYAMEYVQGKSLADEIKANGPMDTTEALRVMKSVCGALGCIHEHKINHLDIKPNNIMIDDKDNRVVLIDFGVSKQYDLVTGNCTTTTPVGISEGYSPLEQYNSGGVNKFSPQSDVYALGATLYKMVTGKTPPTAIDVSQNGLPPFPDNVPVAFVEAIQKAMKSAPAQRPQSVEEFWTLLNGQSQSVGGADEDEDEETCFVDSSAAPAAPVPPAVPAAPKAGRGATPKASAPKSAPQPAPSVAPAAAPTPSVSKKKSLGKKLLIFVVAIIVALCLLFAGLFIYGMYLGATDPKATSENVTNAEENMDYTKDLQSEETPQTVEEILDMVNADCPTSMGEGMTMTEFLIEGSNVICMVEVDESVFRIEDLGVDPEAGKASVIKTFQSGDADPFIDAIFEGGYNFQYCYYGSESGDSYTLTITPEDMGY